MMNAVQSSFGLKTFSRLTYWISGYLFTSLVAGTLIMAWILTSPLLRCGIYLSDLYRRQQKPKSY
jgi:uncharacterized membrane protein